MSPNENDSVVNDISSQVTYGWWKCHMAEDNLAIQLISFI